MAVRIYDYVDFPDATLSSELVFVNNVIKCRKTGLLGNYDPVDGTYKSGTATFPNLELEALDSFIGFEDRTGILVGDDGSETEILYQLSNDGGTTFYYFDSVSSPGEWLVGTDTVLEYSTACDIDSNLDTFPIGASKQVQIRARLIPSIDGLATPLLIASAISYEVDIDHVEDFARTMHRYLDANVSARELQTAKMTGASTVTLPTTLEVTTPIKVFNLTTDPGKVTNLFQSITGKIVTLTATQVGIVQIEYRAKIPNFISANSFFQQSKLPSIAVQILGNIEDLQLTGGHAFEYEIKKCDFTVKKRPREATQRYSVLISCQAENEREAQAIADNVHQVLRTQKIVSNLTGNVFTVLDPVDREAADQAESNLYVKNMVVGVVGRALMPVGTAITEKTVQEINSTVGVFVVNPPSEISTDTQVINGGKVVFNDLTVTTDENT